GTWTPLIIREIAPTASFITVGLLTALPALLGAAAMLLWSRSSDRRDECAWHIRIGLLFAAAGWLLVAEVALPGMRYVGLIVVSAGSFCALSVFWTLCGSLLSGRGPGRDGADQLHRDRWRVGDHPVRLRRSEGLVRQLRARHPVRDGDVVADDPLD